MWYTDGMYSNSTCDQAWRDGEGESTRFLGPGILRNPYRILKTLFFI